MHPKSGDLPWQSAVAEPSKRVVCKHTSLDGSENPAGLSLLCALFPRISMQRPEEGTAPTVASIT